MNKCAECLDLIIGLTDNECECYENDRPDNYNESRSGYFITDTEFGLPLNTSVFGAKTCTADGLNIWQFLEKARAEAIRDVCSDLKKGIYTLNQKYSVFNEQIGQEKAAATNDGSFITGQSLKVRKNIKGGKICIRSISLGLSVSDDVTVTVRKTNDVENVLYSQVVKTVAGKFVKVPFEYEIPMSGAGCDDTYLITYYLPQGASYLENKFKCCGNNPKYPDFIIANGVKGLPYGYSNSEIYEGQTLKSQSSYGNGISIEAGFECDGLDWICDVGNLKGYDFNSLLGATVLFRTVAKIISAIMQTGQINFFTVIDSEMLHQKQSVSLENYQKNISFIVENVPSNLSDCYACSKTLSKQGIKI